jgi:hypothetical protein
MKSDPRVFLEGYIRRVFRSGALMVVCLRKQVIVPNEI